MSAGTELASTITRYPGFNAKYQLKFNRNINHIYHVKTKLKHPNLSNFNLSNFITDKKCQTTYGR